MTRPSLDLHIDTLDDEGRGRATHDGTSVIVPGTAPGAHVRVHVVHRDRRGRLFGEVLERLAPGKGEREAPCHHASPTRGRCGGCPLMHLEEEAQRAFKRDLINDALAPLGQQIEDLQHLAPELGWRNRTTLLVFRTGSGTIRLGSRAPRTGEFARMRGCLVVHPALQRTADAIEDMLPGKWRGGDQHRSAQHDAASDDRDGIPAAGRPQWSPADASASPTSTSGQERSSNPGEDDTADPASRPHPLRHVSLRASMDGHVLVELVTRNRNTDIAELVTAVTALEDVAGVWTGFREADDNVLRSDETTPIVPPGLLSTTFDGRAYPLDPSTFFQLNTAVAEAMAGRLVTLLGTDPVSMAWDLYCGVGVLGHTLLQHAVTTAVVGADNVANAIDVALDVGSSLPGAARSRWLRANLDHGLPASLAQSAPPDIVILNPPRRGVASRLLEQVIAQRPTVIACMSCNPRTFARDARVLLDAGWALEHVEAWDMMPQTTHSELLGLFRRAA